MADIMFRGSRAGLFEPPAAAPCAGMVDMFFSPAPADVAAAKQVCAACPASAACFELAWANREPAGVWGGVSFPTEAKQLVRRSQRRPGAAGGPPAA